MPEKPEYHADFASSMGRKNSKDNLKSSRHFDKDSDRSKSLSGSDLEQRDNEDPNIPLDPGSD